jgi:hypothetical protein
MKLETITLKACGEFSEINEKSFMNYLKAEKQKYFLNDVVYSPFEEALKKKTGYSDSKIPEKVEKDDFSFGRYNFNVTNKPTTKRPNYSEVYYKLVDYLDELKSDAKEKEIEGINLIDGVGYCISVNSVLKKIDKWLETEKGIEQKIGFEKIGYENKLVIPINLRYHIPNEKTAEVFVKTDAFISYLEEKVISPFKNSLKERTGYNNKKIPKESEETWIPVGDNIIRILSSPDSRPGYGKVLNKLIDDFEAIKKGEGISGYKTQIIKNEYYIPMKTTVEKMKKLLEGDTTKFTRHEISFAPDVSLT